MAKSAGRALVDGQRAKAYPKLVDALKKSTPGGCQALAPQSPNYNSGKECGKCIYCRNTALLRELGEID
jgi:hypothetical protein